MHEGILVGIGTMLSDDPQLNGELHTTLSLQVVVLTFRPSSSNPVASPPIFTTSTNHSRRRL